MTRWMVAGLLAMAVVAPGMAQDRLDPIAALERRIDSLSAVRAGLQQRLDEIDTRIEATREEVHRRQFEALEQTELVLVTNMEASLRAQPSPGARVVRMVPAKTMLAAVDYRGDYWKVRYQGLEAWVMRLFVDEGEEARAFKEKLARSNEDERPSDRRRIAGTRHAERAGKSLLITALGVHPPNSAGGVSIYYAFEHLDSTRAIREITFTVTPYNASGDVERGKNSGVSSRRLRRFGPISVRDGEQQYQFDNVWYNERIRCVRIDRIDIVYTNGMRASHIRSIDDLLASGLTNDCTVRAAGTLDDGAAEQ